MEKITRWDELGQGYKVIKFESYSNIWNGIISPAKPPSATLKELEKELGKAFKWQKLIKPMMFRENINDYRESESLKILC